MKSPSVIRMLALSVLGLGLVFAASPVTAGVVDLQVNGSGTAGGTCQLPMVALSSGCTSNSGGDVTGALFGSGIYDLSLTAGNSVAVNSLGGVCLPADSVFKITTATGDLIHFKTVGWLCEEAFPSSNYHYNGTGRIDSGTGTFAAAAGGGNLAATFVKGIGGATFIRITGTISY